MTLFSIVFQYLIFQSFSHSCWALSDSELVISSPFKCSLLSVTFTYTPPHNQFTHTQTHTKYLSSFVDQILAKVLAKEEKQAPKLSFFSPPPVLTYWGDKSFPDLKGLFTCLEKDIFFRLFYLSFFLVICNFTIPFTNCCHGK